MNLEQRHFEFCLKSLSAGIRPEPDITVSQWAEQHRYLVASSSAEPGLWRNARTPYLVEPMDCLSPYSGIEQISVIKGAQGGWTEAGMNWIGAIIHKFPGPALYVQPTVDVVKRHSQTRLSPMINACPALVQRIAESKSRDSSNTIFMKTFPGGTLVLGGANSAANLRSMPVRFLFLDEVDAYPDDVDGEGSPIDLAEKRTTTFRNRKIFKISTPTIAGMSHIEKAYNNGDQRKWFVPCPFCCKTFTMRWRFSTDEAPGGLVWVPKKFNTAQYQCPECSKLIAEHYKTQLNNDGRWSPTKGEGGDPKIRSYYWPSLYSPYGWVGSSWPELAKKWEEGHRDPVKVKVFFNTELGLPYEDKAARSAEPDSLEARAHEFPTRGSDGCLIVPNEVAIVTLGADVQGNRLEYEIVGWGKGEESWSLDYGVITGDTSTYTPFLELQSIVGQKLRNEIGVPLTIHASCIDSNFSTQTVTTWAGPLFQRRVWAVRGSSGRRAIWPRLPGKSKYNSTPLYTLGVDAAKEAIVGRLSIEDYGPGFSHFPTGRTKEYFEQLTSEVCVMVYDKTPAYGVWKKRHPTARNEALDCRVYAYAALCGLLASGINLDAEMTKMLAEIEKKRANLVRPAVAGARAVRFSMTRG